ncbi:MAG: hypothetical protein J6Y77_01095 [Paludibacteraceae bacterium]|nr:hypothetical protein [Paludibacteraceae bacterium]
MKAYTFLPIILLLTALCSCKTSKNSTLETPFVTVVKLIDAEKSLKFEKAQEYIDVIQVYSKLGSEQPMEDWKKMLTFNYNLGKDKKFNNNFGYYDYDIIEKISGHTAEVLFKSKDPDANLQEIQYTLQLIDKQWIVIGINYLKINK